MPMVCFMSNNKSLDKRFCAPDGWKMDNFQNADGKSVRYGHVKPEGDVKGTVVMTTGYGDFMESYFETMHDYLDRGYEVWMMDWAGQGGSERYVTKKPWVPNPKGVESNIRDLKQFRTSVVKPIEDKPVLLNTHSMGGHVAMHYLRRNPKDFDMAVLAAPFVGVRASKFKKGLTRSFSRAMILVGQGNKKIHGSQRDRMVEKIKRVRQLLKKQNPIRTTIHKHYSTINPKLRVGSPTYNWLSNSFKHVAKLDKEAYLKGIKTPVLIVGAGEDDLVDNTVTRSAVVSMKNARYVEIKTATHGLWTERTAIRDEMWGHIDAFINQGGHPSVYKAHHLSANMKNYFPNQK